MSPDLDLIERILDAGLHATLSDLVDEAGHTQAFLARRAGYSEKHVSQMLTGKVDGTLTAWSRLIAAAYGTEEA